jgi:hypothetical protein
MSRLIFVTFCRCSVKEEGKNSGKFFWKNEKTRTCPTGDKGMMRMIKKGILWRLWLGGFFMWKIGKIGEFMANPS